MKDTRHSLGIEGENLACQLLRKKGYSIRHRNYRYRKAEIDIVAAKGNLIVFVEVKSRSTTWIENLAELVSPKQRKMLVLAADQYLVSNSIDQEARFDIITVLKVGNAVKMEHLENAFYHF